MTALADRVSTPVERADFDDLVTLVTQAPPWEKDRSAGVRILLRAIGEGKADAPEQILARWTWRLARATRKARTGARARSSRRRSGFSARSRTRAATGTRRTRRGSSRSRRRMPLDGRRGAARLGRGVHAAREHALDEAREQIAPLPEVAAALAENLPAPKAPSRKSPAPPQEDARRRRRRRSRRAESANGAERRRRGSAPRTGRMEPPPAQAKASPAPAQARPGRSGRHGRGRVAPAGAVRRTAHALRVVRRARPPRRRVPRRRGHLAVAVRPAGAADRARRRSARPPAAGHRRRASSRASRVFTLGAAGSSTCSGCRTTSCATSPSRCSFVVAATLLWPALGERVARLLAFLGRRPAGDSAAGVRPRRLARARLRAVRRPGARRGLGARRDAATSRRTVFLTLAYAVGNRRLPLLGVAFAGRRAGDALRLHAPAVGGSPARSCWRPRSRSRSAWTGSSRPASPATSRRSRSGGAERPRTARAPAADRRRTLRSPPRRAGPSTASMRSSCPTTARHPSSRRSSTG